MDNIEWNYWDTMQAVANTKLEAAKEELDYWKNKNKGKCFE